ncbi:protein NRT1/ PTR FAMILY 2.8-like [Silene latifolia]|uniref:protein NRT1/ PTR FAMILY 2.8-like n=1 Tax=Silene latifolia TaxID=37657 RepID=UPI003D781BBA
MESAQKDVEIGDQHSSTSHTDSPPPRPPGRKRGGWTAIKFILANETFEKLASMSLIANMTVFLRTQYNIDGIFLINVFNIWVGSSNVLTLFGAIVSDAYIGRFYTLLVGSIASMLGMGALTLASGVPNLRPPSCNPESDDCIMATPGQLALLFSALMLLAIASGLIRPCSIAFGADQFDTSTEKGRTQLSRFYNWWYLSFTISLLVALTGVVYVQTNISWVIGFAIPTACFAVSIIIFLSGCSTYIYKVPQGSIFIDMIKVVVAAFRKRKERLISSENKVDFYDPIINESGSGSKVIKLNRSDRLKFFDKAAIIQDSSELSYDGIAKNNWRLCSVQQVEQLKSLIGILPVWVAGILCFIAMDQQNSFGILQAIQMDRKVGSTFVIPPGWIGLTSMISLSIWIILYERVIIRLWRKWSGRMDVRLSLNARIRIGIVMSILSMVTGAITESKRREEAIKAKSFESPLSIAYLVPQLILSGLIEAFAAVSMMEFFTTQMPEQMRSLAGSVFFLSLSMASYLSTVIVNIIYSTTKDEEGMAWLGGHDLNKNKLDYFYAIIACIGVFNFFYFTFVGSKFVRAEDGRSVRALRETRDYETDEVISKSFSGRL